MKKLVTWLVVLILGLSSARAWAWNDVGHMVSAYIAYQELQPQVRQRIADVLKQHPRYRQDMLREMPEGFADPDLYAFMKAATWPDFIRDWRHPMHAVASHPDWHYIDYPLIWPADADRIHQPLPQEQGGEIDNILKALDHSVAQLRDPGTGPADRAIALCWLSHLVGDIHQPLHCTSVFSDQYPEGDRGGNLVLVSANGQVINLHAFWDDLIGAQNAPLAIEVVARNILANPNYQRASLTEMLGHRDFKSWAQESFVACRDITYMGGKLHGAPAAAPASAPSLMTTPPTTATHMEHAHRPTTAPALPVSYEDVARQLAHLRIALAGHRLADQLNEIFQQP